MLYIKSIYTGKDQLSLSQNVITHTQTHSSVYERFILICCQHPNIQGQTHTRAHTHTHTEHQMAGRAAAKLCFAFTSVVGCKEMGRGRTERGEEKNKRTSKDKVQ